MTAPDEQERIASHLRWCTTTVRGRTVEYGDGGNGPVVVFLHGWGLAHRSYKRALRRVVETGARVIAPAMPGFAGSAELPEREVSLPGYARWLRDFLREIGVDGPVTLVGHSFGGGVAIQTAYDHPTLVGGLVIVNSIGGSAWTEEGGVVKAMRERPIWDWGLHLQADVMPRRQLSRVLPVILGDAVPNLIRNPRAIWRVAHVARTADLTPQLVVLRQRRLPVVILWGASDTVIPAAALASLRRALGDAPFVTVDGNHSWLLADPDAFGEVMTNVLSELTAPAEVA